MTAPSEITVQEFLEKVEARGVHLKVGGDHIRLGWPEKTPNPEIRQAIIYRLRKKEKPRFLDTKKGY